MGNPFHRLQGLHKILVLILTMKSKKDWNLTICKPKTSKLKFCPRCHSPRCSVNECKEYGDLHCPRCMEWACWEDSCWTIDDPEDRVSIENRNDTKWHCKGLLEPGGRGATAPPLFAKISLKFLGSCPPLVGKFQQPCCIFIGTRWRAIFKIVLFTIFIYQTPFTGGVTVRKWKNSTLLWQFFIKD